MSKSLAILALLGVVACAAPMAGQGVRSRPGDAEARFIYYADDNDLSVTTLTARVEQPLSDRSSAFARGIADHVVLKPKPLHAPHPSPGQPTGHRDADVVTSASSSAGEAAGSDKWRFEGLFGGQLGFDVKDMPASARAYGRISSEPDYASYSGLVRFTMDAAERNTTISLFGGYGYDRVSPFEAPPGQEGQWPATHQRVVLGGSLAQVLSPSVLLTLGAGATRQSGALSSPYRRAVVRTTLFPEALPGERYRVTGFVMTSVHLGFGTAVHLRTGIYADSWGVLGFVPEGQIAKEIGARLLLGLRYRFVGQSSADFYQPTYSSIMPIMAGDARLGALDEHAGGLSARWTFLGSPGDFGSVSVFAEEEVSRLRYERIDLTVVSSVTSCGLAVAY